MTDSAASNQDSSPLKFRLQLLAKILPISLSWSFLDGKGTVFNLECEDDNRSKVKVKIYNKENNCWNMVEERGDEWPTINGFQGFHVNHFKRNVAVITHPGSNGSLKVWLFATDTLRFRRVGITSQQEPQGCQYVRCVVGSKLLLQGYKSSENLECWMLDLDEAVQTCEGSWEKLDFIHRNAFIYNSVSTRNHLLWCQLLNDKKSMLKIDFFSRTCLPIRVNHTSWPFEKGHRFYTRVFGKTQILIFGTDRNDKYRALSIETKGHQGQQPLTSKPMFPGDEKTKRMLEYQQFSVLTVTQSRQNGETIFLAITPTGNSGLDIEQHIYALKVIDESDDMASSVKDEYMRKILLSAKYTDMALIVGKNKIRIPLHKIIMDQSPWVER